MFVPMAHQRTSKVDPDTDPDTLDLFRAWLIQSKRAPKTRAIYCRAIAAYVEWLGTRGLSGASSTPLDAAAYLASLRAGGAQDSVVAQTRAALRTFSGWAMRSCTVGA